MDAVIQVEALGKRYGEVRALAGLDLSVERGGILGLLGHNGAGKTTLVRILATLLRPDSGRALVGGFDAVRQPVAVRRLIGLAGQNAAVDEALTGRENLEIVGRLGRLPGWEIKQRAARILDEFSLSDAADRPVRTYSGGMRRRLDLAASLVPRPQVLLLDEPTTGLDPVARQQLWERVKALSADGTTVLLTTQYLEEADHLADQVAVLEHGRLLEQGTPAQLKRRLGDDTIAATVADPSDLLRAAAVLADVSTSEPSTDPASGVVTVRVPSGSGGLAVAVRLLDQAHVSLADVTVKAPSLEDVYFALTGGLDGGGEKTKAGAKAEGVGA
jgi:daunorubicin resistance ABC transporter ATP-binding subunit